MYFASDESDYMTIVVVPRAGRYFDAGDERLDGSGYGSGSGGSGSGRRDSVL